MKNILYSIRVSFIISFFLFLATVSFAQQTKQEKKAAKADQLKEMVESKNYVFVAQSVMPMGGRSRQLTSLYTLDVKPDTVICDLPYMGRVYSAPMGSSEGGIKFTATDFDYTMAPGKKGGWTISIKTKGQGSEELTLSISESGYASLRVSSSNRQAISFNGIIESHSSK
ncbi:MAG TPA: DUF4251 domain-containing protein [Chryseolinea sp.]|nr:DUF4251 domain-containing protein [Chryseolinea sp.]HPM31933.1 DUF4251 domain-containing protein [Chryseolinea sp.]